MYETLQIVGYLPYHLVQDFFQQQYQTLFAGSMVRVFFYQ